MIFVFIVSGIAIVSPVANSVAVSVFNPKASATFPVPVVLHLIEIPAASCCVVDWGILQVVAIVFVESVEETNTTLSKADTVAVIVWSEVESLAVKVNSYPEGIEIQASP